MQKSSALQKLEEILTKAIDNGIGTDLCGHVLLSAMELENQAHNMMDFYELLNKAKEEVRSIENGSKVERSIRTIENVQAHFVLSHPWSTQWKISAEYIQDKNILTIIDSLANLVRLEVPSLDKDFLEKLYSQFNLLLEETIKSDLSVELKVFLKRYIESLLRAIRRFQLDGTKGLKQAAKSFVSDLVMDEHRFKDIDKKNPVYTRIQAWSFSLILYLIPSPYDVIGTVPNIYDFWIPKFEELSAGSAKIEEMICESSSMQEAFEKASDVFDRREQKSITSTKEMKALPASKEN